MLIVTPTRLNRLPVGNTSCFICYMSNKRRVFCRLCTYTVSRCKLYSCLFLYLLVCLFLSFFLPSFLLRLFLPSLFCMLLLLLFFFFFFASVAIYLSMMYYSVMIQANSEKEIPSAPIRSRT